MGVSECFWEQLRDEEKAVSRLKRSRMLRSNEQQRVLTRQNLRVGDCLVPQETPQRHRYLATWEFPGSMYNLGVAKPQTQRNSEMS